MHPEPSRDVGITAKSRWWIEAAVLEGKPTGVARFLGNVLRVWCHASPKPAIELLFRSQPAHPWTDLTSAFPSHTIPFRFKSYLLWQQGPLRRQIRRLQPPDVFLSPNYSLPLGLPCHRALILHDLSFFRHPEWFPLKFRLFYRRVIARSIQDAHLIFVPSQFIADELRDFFPHVTGTVTVTSEGWDPALLEPPTLKPSELFQRFAIPRDAFVLLSPGSLFRRRRPELLIQSLKALTQRSLPASVHLVIIGDNRTYPPLNLGTVIHRYQMENRIHWLGYQPESVLHAFYHACHAVIYLSEYEGFGLPVLEALALGKPVLASEIPVFKELFFNAAYLVPHHPDAIADAILRLMETPQPGPAAPDVKSRFTWEKTADRIYLALEQLPRETKGVIKRNER